MNPDAAVPLETQNGVARVEGEGCGPAAALAVTAGCAVLCASCIHGSRWGTGQRGGFPGTPFTHCSGEGNPT